MASARFISGAMAGKWTSLDQVWEGDFYLWSRAVTALFGVMTVYVAYRIGRRWHPTVGLIAALMTAVYPNLVHEAHFALTDTPLTFFVTETLLLSLVAGETGLARWFLLAGVTTGFAAATKYNGAVALLMPLAAALIAPAVRLRWAAALTVCCGAAVGFLLTAPYTVLDIQHFLNAFGSLASHFSRDLPPMEATRTHLKHMRIAFGLGQQGWSLAIGSVGFSLSLFGLAVLATQLFSPVRRTAALVTLVFPLAYFWMIVHQSQVFARYSLPIIPMMCLSLAIAIRTIGTRLSRPVGPHQLAGRAPPGGHRRAAAGRAGDEGRLRKGPDQDRGTRGSMDSGEPSAGETHRAGRLRGSASLPRFPHGRTRVSSSSRWMRIARRVSITS